MRNLSIGFFSLLIALGCGDDSSALDAGSDGADVGASDSSLPDVFALDAPIDDAGVDAAMDAADARVFDPGDLVWSEVGEPAEGPLMVWGALVAPIDDFRALVFGGTTASRTNNTILDGTWLYTWADGVLSAEEVEGEGPAARYCGCASYDPERDVVVLGGGRNFEATVTLVPETWELDLGTREWTRVDTDTTPIGGLGCNMAYVNGATYWFGGANARRELGAFGTNSQTWRYDPATREWTEVAVEGPSPRYDAHFVQESDSSVLLFGGAFSAAEDMQGDVWRFDGSTWTQLADNGAGPDGRRVAWVAEAPGGFVVAGGFDADMNTLGDMWRWNEGEWTELSQGAPERIAFAARLPAGPASLGVMMSGYDGDGPVRALRQLHVP